MYLHIHVKFDFKANKDEDFSEQIEEIKGGQKFW